MIDRQDRHRKAPQSLSRTRRMSPDCRRSNRAPEQTSRPTDWQTACLDIDSWISLIETPKTHCDSGEIGTIKIPHLAGYVFYRRTFLTVFNLRAFRYASPLLTSFSEERGHLNCTTSRLLQQVSRKVLHGSTAYLPLPSVWPYLFASM